MPKSNFRPSVFGTINIQFVYYKDDCTYAVRGYWQEFLGDLEEQPSSEITITEVIQIEDSQCKPCCYPKEHLCNDHDFNAAVEKQDYKDE